jgi:hypothetical protein
MYGAMGFVLDIASNNGRTVRHNFILSERERRAEEKEVHEYDRDRTKLLKVEKYASLSRRRGDLELTHPAPTRVSCSSGSCLVTVLGTAHTKLEVNSCTECQHCYMPLRANKTPSTVGLAFSFPSSIVILSQLTQNFLGVHRTIDPHACDESCVSSNRPEA